ncbi:hypothetical protein B296_00045822 [Ensete ventricosum]|uniref:Uncharacterized protein n=1 Tax=Ensete ventricosum TaxID=4639 RepID=A0A426XBX7_ENSVE|nr:hypothetical protein B296_00045822 [Ensete ventricosum]
MRGIANSENSVLMQGFVCELWSVRDPKAIGTWRHGTSELSLQHGKDTCMIRGYWELHFGKQHYDKKCYGLRSEYHGMIGAAGELDCFSALICLRELDKSEDKAEWSKGMRKRQRFDYSTTAAESSWEPRVVLQPKQKIKDLAKGEKMQCLQRL